MGDKELLINLRLLSRKYLAPISPGLHTWLLYPREEEVRQWSTSRHLWLLLGQVCLDFHLPVTSKWHREMSGEPAQTEVFHFQVFSIVIWVFRLTWETRGLGTGPHENCLHTLKFKRLVHLISIHSRHLWGIQRKQNTENKLTHLWLKKQKQKLPCQLMLPAPGA